MTLFLAMLFRECRGFVAEHRFHPIRRWRFDFCWPNAMVAVEIDGATWTRGRHTRGKGFQADLEKMNAATVLGWRVLRYTTQDIERRPIQVIEEIKGLLQ